MKSNAPQKERAAAPTTAPKYCLQDKAYRKDTFMSRQNLTDQIGLLLWFLCSPISEKQIVAGYRLLEILLSARYELGQI